MKEKIDGNLRRKEAKLQKLKGNGRSSYAMGSHLQLLEFHELFMSLCEGARRLSLCRDLWNVIIREQKKGLETLWDVAAQCYESIPDTKARRTFVESEYMLRAIFRRQQILNWKQIHLQAGKI